MNNRGSRLALTIILIYYLQSPLFNWTSVQTEPFVSLKIWWSSQTGYDGAVLQFTLNLGLTWTTLGSLSDPLWYNQDPVLGLPYSGQYDPGEGNNFFH